MWGGSVLLSLVRQGLRRRPRRRTARVVDEGAAPGDAAGATGGDVAAPRDLPATAAAGAVLARAVMAVARCAVGRLDGEGGAAASGWSPARAADEVGHLMARESLCYVIYA